MYSLSLSLRFDGHFPGGGPGLAGTRMSPFWILLELRVMVEVSGDNWRYKRCKAPVKMSPLTNRHPVFLLTFFVCVLNPFSRTTPDRVSLNYLADAESRL